MWCLKPRLLWSHTMEHGWVLSNFSDSVCIWFWIHLWLSCIQRLWNAATFPILSLSYWPHMGSWSRVEMMNDKEYEGYDHTHFTPWTLVCALCLKQSLETIFWHDGYRGPQKSSPIHNTPLFNLQVAFLPQRLEAYDMCSGPCVKIRFSYSQMPKIISS